MKSSFEIHRSSAARTSIERSEPAAKTRGPQAKICKYHLRWPIRSNRARGEENQAKLRVRRFPLADNGVRNFADQCESDGRRIVPLDIHERLDQFALIDA